MTRETRLLALEMRYRSMDYTAWVLANLAYLQGLIGIREPAPRPRELSESEIEAEPASLNILSVIEAVERRRHDIAT